MADFKRLARKNLPSPPSMDEATDNIQAPETAPAPKVVAMRPARIDGRSLRRSGRTLQFATRVTPEFDNELRVLAERDGLMLVEVLERALELYKKQAKR